MTWACLSNLCAHAEIQTAEGASIETMLELLPRDVGYAVAHSFQQRYSLSSPLTSRMRCCAVGFALGLGRCCLHMFQHTMQKFC